MTPEQLREWRAGFGWSTAQAARELDISERTYKYHEQGISSYGTIRPKVPKVIELATLELGRRYRKRRRSSDAAD